MKWLQDWYSEIFPLRSTAFYDHAFFILCRDRWALEKDRAWYSKEFQWQLYFYVFTSVEIYILYFSRKYLYFFFLDGITPWSSSSGSSRNTSEINLFHYSYFKQYLNSKRGIERERIDNVQTSHEKNKGKFKIQNKGKFRKVTK